MQTIRPAALNNKELARLLETEDVRRVPREYLEQAALRFMKEAQHNSNYGHRRDAVHFIA